MKFDANIATNVFGSIAAFCTAGVAYIKSGGNTHDPAFWFGVIGAGAMGAWAWYTNKVNAEKASLEEKKPG